MRTAKLLTSAGEARHAVAAKQTVDCVADAMSLNGDLPQAAVAAQHDGNPSYMGDDVFKRPIKRASGINRA